MSKTYTAPFAQTPQTATAVATTAAASIDTTPTNTQLLLTAGADGAILSAARQVRADYSVGVDRGILSLNQRAQVNRVNRLTRARGRCW